MLVDSHLHIWRPLPAEQPSPPTTIDGHADVPVELVDDYLTEYGIDRAVLVQPMYPGEDNSYVADAAARRPDRFAAVCVVDPTIAGAADRLSYWVRQRGCRGLRLRPRFPPEAAAFGSPQADPLWEFARDAAVVMSILCGPEHLPIVQSLAQRFPEVAIVVDHLGHPNVAQSIDVPDFRLLLDLARQPRVFVKLSGFYYISREPYPYRDTWDIIRSVYESFGPDRLLWGSDFPHVLLKTGYRRSVEFFTRHLDFIAAGEQEQIMGENARQLYWPGDNRVD